MIYLPPSDPYDWISVISFLSLVWRILFLVNPSSLILLLLSNIQQTPTSAMTPEELAALETQLQQREATVAEREAEITRHAEEEEKPAPLQPPRRSPNAPPNHTPSRSIHLHPLNQNVCPSHP